jgi:hypothetical protein
MMRLRNTAYSYQAYAPCIFDDYTQTQQASPYFLNFFANLTVYTVGNY